MDDTPPMTQQHFSRNNFIKEELHMIPGTLYDLKVYIIRHFYE